MILFLRAMSADMNLFKGVYKVPYPPREFIKSVGEEYQVVKRVREYHGCGEVYNVDKNGKLKQYHLP